MLPSGRGSSCSPSTRSSFVGERPAEPYCNQSRRRPYLRGRYTSTLIAREPAGAPLRAAGAVQFLELFCVVVIGSALSSLARFSWLLVSTALWGGIGSQPQRDASRL